MRASATWSRFGAYARPGTLLRENFPEIVRTVWAPYVILKANTEGLSKEEADRVINDLADVARAGKSIAVNESVEPTVVDLTPDIKGLNEDAGDILEVWEREIDRIYRLYKGVSVKASEYRHIEESKRYPEG